MGAAVTDGATSDPARESAAATQAILADLARAEGRGIVVDSPPGAGKSTLVVTCALALVAGGERCMIIAQTNTQVDDLVARLAARDPSVRIGRVSAADYVPPPSLARLANVAVSNRVADLERAGVVIGTAAKWATVREGTFAWAIVDEAYQMRSDLLLQVAERFDRALFVGDPGQLDPFSIVESERWIGLPHDPMQSAVAVLLQHNDLPVHRLPVSWRLPASAAPVIARAFYPFTGFRSGTDTGTRTLSYGAGGARAAADDTLDMAVAHGWALHELPGRPVPRTDAQTARAAADIAARALARGVVAACEHHPDGRAVTAADIAVGVAHRDQADQIRALLRHGPVPGAADVTVDTANRLQGREFEITIVVHPLSGRRDATAFHLEAGRLCVLASRHRQACIVVARQGIADLLDTHPSTEPVHLDVEAKFPDGWEGNQEMMTHLERFRVAA
jgi:AAA domain